MKTVKSLRRWRRSLSPISAEDTLLYQIRADGLPEPVREYKFHPHRRWRFDFAWPDLKLAVEVEGGLWQWGRHNRPAGYEEDLEKYNEATLLGWRLLRFSTDMVVYGLAVETIKRFMEVCCGEGGERRYGLRLYLVRFTPGLSAT